MRQSWTRLRLALGFVLLFAVCGRGQTQLAHSSALNQQSPSKAVSCTKDSQCPSGQRCGFAPGTACEAKGRCVVPSGDAHCIDPGGRCGCDGRPVDIFCVAGSKVEFTSAPVNAVGPCPRFCNDDSQCAHGLLCRNGFCGKP